MHPVRTFSANSCDTVLISQDKLSREHNLSKNLVEALDNSDVVKLLPFLKGVHKPVFPGMGSKGRSVIHKRTLLQQCP